MPTPLRIHVDFLSPYAYLAWTQIRALGERHGRAVEGVPVLFAAMLDAFGTVGPAEVPVKRIYTFKDVLRKAHLLGVPLRVPPAHPFPPLLPLRIATAADDASRSAVIDALFAAVWGRGEAIDTTEGAAQALTAAGLDTALVARASEPAVKARLTEVTKDAIARGIFGVPTTVADGEPFWGLDALPSLEAFLVGKDPVSREDLERLASTPIGIQRKRA